MANTGLAGVPAPILLARDCVFVDASVGEALLSRLGESAIIRGYTAVGITAV